MSAWGNTDKLSDKPKMPVERTAAPKVTYSANVATFAVNGGGAGVAANANTLFLPSTIGIVPGMSVGGNNILFNTAAGLFAGNTLVGTVNSGNVVLTPAPGQQFALSGNVVVGDTYVFSNTVPYKAGTYETTFNKDTVLVTVSRLANATVNVNHTSTGWTHVRKKVNGDGTVRYLTEVLVCLANATAANTSSGQTSNISAYTGV